MNQVLRAYLAITVLAVSWGTIPLIIRTSEINSISLVGIRTFIGSIFLGIILLNKDVSIRELIKPGLILGPLLAIHWVTMFESIELNSVAVGIGLVFSYPIFVIFIVFDLIFESIGYHNSRQIMEKYQGRVLVFDSKVAHKVCPVTSGKRIALVGWASGPQLR